MFDSEQNGSLLDINIKGYYLVSPRAICTMNEPVVETKTSIPVDLNITEEISITLDGQKNEHRIIQNNLHQVDVSNVFIR